MTNAPTTELALKHDVEPPRVDARAFRQGWRIRTRLDQLRADGRITEDEWRIAGEYRAACDVLREVGSSEPGVVRAPSANHADAAAIARIDAATRIRLVHAAIGPDAVRILAASVLFDLAWAKIGRFMRRDPETVRDWTVRALKLLARAWEGSSDPDGLPYRPTR